MDSEPRKKVGFGCMGWAVMLFALVLLYVLSIGPAVWLRTNNVITHDTLVSVYYPISWLETKSPLFAEPIEAYCRLWAGNGPPTPP
jgi:hypothetical protein